LNRVISDMDIAPFVGLTYYYDELLWRTGNLR
jgi:hypothetical protein